MTSYYLSIASVLVLTPIAIFLGKKLYIVALKRGWKKPEQYAYFFNTLMIVPAMTTMRVLENITGLGIFMDNADSSSVVDWIFSVCIIILLVSLYSLPLHFKIEKYLKEQETATT